LVLVVAVAGISDPAYSIALAQDTLIEGEQCKLAGGTCQCIMQSKVHPLHIIVATLGGTIGPVVDLLTPGH
jgi:hypothetical protein